MIEATEVTKRYGSVVALDDVSLSVPNGASLGLVGTNGAGKTTLFRLLVGHETPDSGTVRVAGVDPTEGTRVRERVGYLPEDAGFQPSLTGEEVLGYYAAMRGDGDLGGRIDTLLSVVGLADAADREVGGYSNGMNRRLGLAVALLGGPEVLLLDEPTAGLDPAGVDAFNRVVERVRDQRDVTVVLSTHVLSEVEALCDRVAILDGGSLRTVGPVEDVVRGASQDVTITARYESDAALASATEQLESVSAEVSRTLAVEPTHSAGTNGLELIVDSEEVTDVLREVLDTDPDSVRVDEPTLESAVHETITAGGDAA